MVKYINILLFMIIGILSSCAQQRPILTFTSDGLASIKQGGPSPFFDKIKARAIQTVNASITEGVKVPIPKDMAGGYTHEQHKKNYRIMHLAGALYQIDGDEKYARYIKDVLIEYARIYKSLPIHPTDRSYATGKIFWQCLNDANWLVYTSQAYDCIYNYLSKSERDYLESDLFRPYADFISVENPQFFNRIHNHSTWGNAAVGMIGLVMGDEELVDRALYGITFTAEDQKSKDDDGGYIFEKGKAGFFAQIDNAFSPDGYYTEGPYYQRYAMTPFMFFANSLQQAKPELEIFGYRDNLLIKAVYALLYQSDKEGRFFPINDAQKGMSIHAESVVAAVNIAYGISKDPQLLDIALQQGDLILDQNGYAISKGIDEGKNIPFVKKSIELRDGAQGNEGALGILRTSDAEKEILAIFKYTGQGLGHGHYDKLSYTLYDNETEVLQDYGAARWVNIDQKAGGRYLKENKTWAKQTIAHNTLVVDQTSHFGGVYEIANANHSEPYYFDVSNNNFQVASAKEKNAYPGIEMHRTLFLVKDEALSHPVVIDLMTTNAEQAHNYDMAYQYGDHLLETNLDYSIALPGVVLGEGHGYQHLYQEAAGSVNTGNLYFNWFKDDKFYSLTSVADQADKMILARIGANDPDFNLKREALLIHRKENSKDVVFLTAIESHGSYSRVTELVDNPYRRITSVQVDFHDDNYTVFTITSISGKSWTIMFSQNNIDPDKTHSLNVSGKNINWQGPVQLIINDKK